jgi:hypothetical protein
MHKPIAHSNLCVVQALGRLQMLVSEAIPIALEAYSAAVGLEVLEVRQVYLIL